MKSVINAICAVFDNYAKTAVNPMQLLMEERDCILNDFSLTPAPILSQMVAVNAIAEVDAFLEYSAYVYQLQNLLAGLTAGEDYEQAAEYEARQTQRCEALVAHLVTLLMVQLANSRVIKPSLSSKLVSAVLDLKDVNIRFYLPVFKKALESVAVCTLNTVNKPILANTAMLRFRDIPAWNHETYESEILYGSNTQIYLVEKYGRASDKSTPLFANFIELSELQEYPTLRQFFNSAEAFRLGIQPLTRLLDTQSSAYHIYVFRTIKSYHSALSEYINRVPLQAQEVESFSKLADFLVNCLDRKEVMDAANLP